jgi:DNA-binding MarR family transcriptional regulator
MSLLGQNYQGTGASVAEVTVLFQIAEHDGCSARDIASALALDKGYLSRMLARLEHEGVITRKPVAGDRRLLELSLTAKGRKRIAEYERLGRGIVGDVVEGLSDAECRELVSHMTAIERLLGIGAYASHESDTTSDDAAEGAR